MLPTVDRRSVAHLGRGTAVAASIRSLLARGALLLGLLLVFAACGGSSMSAASGAPAPAGVQPAASAGAAQGGGSGGEDQSGRTPTGGAPEDTSDAVTPADTALVVKTGTLSLEVEDLDGTLVRARSVVVGAGGFISGSDESRSGERQVASITYRIPAERWDETLAGLRALEGITVDSEKTDAVEVTGQVVDLEARITNLRATESQLQAFLGQAGDIPDLLEVQRELTGVREQIERLVAQTTELRDQASFGTLTVTYQTPIVVVAVNEAQLGWDPAREFDRAVAQIILVGQGFASLGIWLLVVALPIVLGFGLLIGIALVLSRRFGRRLPQRGPSPPAA